MVNVALKTITFPIAHETHNNLANLVNFQGTGPDSYYFLVGSIHMVGQNYNQNILNKKGQRHKIFYF
jgi:hypothetical protein